MTVSTVSKVDACGTKVRKPGNPHLLNRTNRTNRTCYRYWYNVLVLHNLVPRS